MIAADVTFDLSKVDRFLTRLQRERVPKAASRALNNAAFAYRKALQEEMSKQFDRPTPYTLRSFLVEKAGVGAATQASTYQIMGLPSPASSGRIEAKVFLSYTPNKQGLDPFDTIGHQFTGGAPKFTGFERALHRIGVLPLGWHAVPGKGAKLNAYGNVSPGLIVQLISYFQAFGEQGYRANSTERTRKRRAGKGIVEYTDVASRRLRKAKTIAGVEYFISRGRGEFTGGNTWRSGRYQHLPSGIWMRRGTHGWDIAPVFLFVRSVSYRRRINIEAVAQRIDLAGLIAREFARNIGARP